MNQWKRVENSEKIRSIYDQLIFYKDARSIHNGRRIVSLINGVGKVGYPCAI